MRIVDIVLVEEKRGDTKVGKKEAVPVRCLSLLDGRSGPLWMLCPTALKMDVGEFYIIFGRVSTYYQQQSGRLSFSFRIDEARRLRMGWALRKLYEIGDPAKLLPNESAEMPDPSALNVEDDENDDDVPF
jgi:hypothetical protein